MQKNFRSSFRRSSCIVLILLCVAAAAVAQGSSTPGDEPAPSSGELFGPGDPRRSVAVTDDYSVADINPAGVAVGNAAGLAAEATYDLGVSGSETSARPDQFSLYVNSDSSSYRFRHGTEGFSHYFALGFSPVRNLYFGGGYGVADGDWKTGDLDVGTLFRPWEMLSLGARGRLAGLATGEARLGIGLRPLYPFPDWSSRLTLGADVRVTQAGFDSLSLSLGAEPVAGLELSVGYRPSSGTVTGAVSVSLSHARTGGGTAAETGGDGFTEAGAFLHLSPKRFRSALRRTVPGFVEYEPGPVILEQEPLFTIPEFGEDRTATITEVVRQIDRMAADPSVQGLVFRKRLFQTSFANIVELRDALRRFKTRGKHVVFYYEAVDNLNYALAASVADRIYLHPSGSVGLVGLQAVRPYVNELLRRAGIEVVNLTAGAYKSAGNVFSRDSMPEEEREALRFVLDGQYATFVSMIEEGRGDRLAGDARAVVDAGPYLQAGRAVEQGLVDELIYEDQLEEKLAELPGGGRLHGAWFPEKIRYNWSRSRTARIGLIVATGSIHTGEGDPATSIGSDTLTRALRRARTDASIDAVLLRIDSGGGSAIASDVIAREVELLRQEKPVVVSMGGTAASGGYYIASPATTIFAQPVTITGSIGVVAVIPSFQELSERLGITWESVLMGERADFAALYRSLSPEEKQLIQESIDTTYDRFVQAVASGRPLSEAEVRDVAEGRIWTGAQAAERGLVDEVGGLSAAMEAIKERVGKERPAEIVPITGRKGLMASATSFDLAGRILRALIRNEVPSGIRDTALTLETLSRFEPAQPLYLLPYRFGSEG